MLARRIGQHAAIAALSSLTLAIPYDQTIARDKTSGKTIEFTESYSTVVVIGGKTVQLKVAADAFKWPILNASLASALELKSGPFKGTGKNDEGQKVAIKSKVVRSQYGDSKKRQRALWSDRDLFSGVDGVVGPTGLGYEIVRMKLRPAMPGETVVTHPLRSFPLIGLAAAFFQIDIAGERVNVDFNLERRDTLVNASTGKLLADTYGGALSGDPVTYTLFDGKRRPGRRLVLERPFVIDGRAAGDLAVRIRPDATTSIPDSTAVPDPDEIVVTAKSKKKPRYWVSLGTDYLQKCSSITYDLRAKTVALSCAAVSAG